jgi:ADP-sugar diphosphatase
MSASSVMIEIHGNNVPVTGPPDLDLAFCVKATPFVNWVSTLDPGLDVSEIKIHGVDYFGKRIGFLKLEAVTKCNGDPVPGIIFMRGGAVSILLILYTLEDSWVVCTRQARVPIGKTNFLEVPAGMLDDSGNFAGVAAKELEEETGIRLSAADLRDMTAMTYEACGEPHPEEVEAKVIRDKSTPLKGMYPSPGGSDEFIRLMLHEKQVSKEELNALRGKLTGCAAEGEKIVLEIVKFDILWRTTSDSKALSSLCLFNNLMTSGQL